MPDDPKAVAAATIRRLYGALVVQLEDQNINPHPAIGELEAALDVLLGNTPPARQE